MSTSTAGAKPSYLAGIETVMVEPELEEVRYLTVGCGDGRQSTLYEFGQKDAEPVVLLPPYGMTFLTVARLARLLARRFRVLIWESRACPDPATPVRDTDFELADQSRHFSEVLAQAGIESFHFVGWCQAAQLAVHATAHGLIKPRTLSWIAPAGLGYSLVKSEFDRCALPIYLEIARHGVAHAGKLGRILNKYNGVPATPKNAAEKLTMVHLSDPEMTHVFSRYMKAYDDHRRIAGEFVSAALEAVPTLSIHCRDDTYSHFSESVQLAKRHPSLELRLLGQGGHLQVFNEPATLAEHVLGFMDARASQRALSPAMGG
ncbi:alpha/beta hydrolase [Corallococcus interemptor]|uniref:alpha/beta fold hydrolase n=1 Tax=Corallococcus TaxID=83461 RepID=UPI0035D42342